MSDLRFTAAVHLQAAAEGKPPRVNILAYSGGIMTVDGWGDVALVLAGLELPPTIPLLGDHDATLSGAAGQGTPTISSGSLHVNGTLASNETGQRILALARDNVPLQASVGVNPTDRVVVRAGDKTTVNGRTVQAGPRGLTVVNRGLLREVSITPLGADASTSVTIAAKGATMSVGTETNNVDLVQAERSRVAEIHAELRTYLKKGTSNADELEQIADRAIEAGDDVNKASLAMLRASRGNVRTPAGSYATADHGTPLQAIEASLLIRAGRESLAVKHYGERTTDHARRMQCSSLVDVIRAVMQTEHRDPSGMSRSELIRAGFSTLSLPNALANVMGKTLVDAYQEATDSWRGFASVKPAADFKPQSAIRPSFVGELEKLPKTGEIKHGTLNEAAFPWSVDTYAKMFTVDRQTVINDDLGFIDQTPVLMGKSAARAVNDLVWSVILANAGSFFAAGHSNLIHAALDLAGFGSAVAAMRSQRDGSGNDIQIRPRVLAVPPELEATARGIVSTAPVGRVDGESMANVWSGMVDVVVESRLSNTSKFTNASVDDWYLFAGPSDAPIIVGFLDGRQTPIIETFGFDSEPNVLAMTYRCYHDFGCALGDHRAALKSDVTPYA